MMSEIKEMLEHCFLIFKLADNSEKTDVSFIKDSEILLFPNGSVRILDDTLDLKFILPFNNFDEDFEILQELSLKYNFNLYYHLRIQKNEVLYFVDFIINDKQKIIKFFEDLIKIFFRGDK